jgi:hypothetical protein
LIKELKTVTDIDHDTFDTTYPGHCFVCHLANSEFVLKKGADLSSADNIATDPKTGEWLEDYSSCGPHCKKPRRVLLEPFVRGILKRREKK